LKNEYKSISTPLAGKIKNTNPNTIRSNGLTKITIGTAAIYGKVTKGIVPAFDQLVVIENNQIIYSKDDVIYQFNQNEIRVIKILESFDNFDYKDQILSIFTSKELIIKNHNTIMHIKW
jgi:hypothetical protein